MASSINNNRVSILIVDDHEVVRNGIRSYLETLTQFNVVGEAASGEEALKLVSEHIPDIVLLDLIMPGMDGVETTRLIKSQRPQVKIIALSMYAEYAADAAAAGADAFVSKGQPPEQLLATLAAVVAGQ